MENGSVKKKKVIAILVTALACVCVVLLRDFGTPQYQNVRVNKWFSRFVDKRTDNTAREAIVFHLGGDAIPYLVSVLREKETPLSKFYETAWQKVPSGIQKALPLPFNQLSINKRKDAAISLLQSIGQQQSALFELGKTDGKPDIGSAMPELIEIIEQDARRRVDVISACSFIGPKAAAAAPAIIRVLSTTTNQQEQVQCIQALGRIGPAAGSAVPVLSRILQGTNSRLHNSVLFNIGRVGPAATTAIPTVVPFLESTNAELRRGAVFALNEMGYKLDKQKPILLKMLNSTNPNDFARIPAAVALWRLDHGDAKASNVIAGYLASKQDPRFCSATAYQLSMLKGEAIPFVPSLKTLLAESDDNSRYMVAFALRKITNSLNENTKQ